MNLKTSELLSIIEDIHAAALDRSLWPLVLQQIGKAVKSEAGTVFIHDFNDSSVSFDGNGPNIATLEGFDPDFVESYATHYIGLNPWMASEEKMPSGAVVMSSLLFPDKELTQTPFYGEWLHPQDLFYSVGLVIEKEDTRAVAMSFLRSERTGTYSSGELQLMKVLMPHLRMAAQVHRRLHSVASLVDASFAALDKLSFGVVLLSQAGTFAHWNQAAGQIARATGAYRIAAGGQVRAISPELTAALSRAIAAAGHAGNSPSASPGISLHLPARAGGGVHVFIVPVAMARQVTGTQVATALFITDPSAILPSLVSSLREIYRMTAAEAALAEALARGQTLKEFAGERGVSMNTVRTQLQAVTAKVGVKRQVDVVRAILTGPAVLRLGVPPQDP